MHYSLCVMCKFINNLLRTIKKMLEVHMDTSGKNTGRYVMHPLPRTLL